jgi:Zn ribbon nucleic-acid-binding protein
MDSCPRCGGRITVSYCVELGETFIDCLQCGYAPEATLHDEHRELCDACGEELPEGEYGECGLCKEFGPSLVGGIG